jgi:hypothetical protein
MILCFYMALFCHQRSWSISPGRAWDNVFSTTRRNGNIGDFGDVDVYLWLEHTGPNKASEIASGILLFGRENVPDIPEVCSSLNVLRLSSGKGGLRGTSYRLRLHQGMRTCWKYQPDSFLVLYEHCQTTGVVGANEANPMLNPWVIRAEPIFISRSPPNRFLDNASSERYSGTHRCSSTKSYYWIR